MRPPCGMAAQHGARRAAAVHRIKCTVKAGRYCGRRERRGKVTIHIEAFKGQDAVFLQAA